jgi:ABC-type lipoprotein export system ATPase subunit
VAIIQAGGLTKQFDQGSNSVLALRKVDLKVERGEFLAIVGPSGSGKSTLLGILGCLEHPTTGQLAIDGVDVTGLDENALAAVRNEKIGFVFQFFNLIPALSALENVKMPLYFRRERMSDKKIGRRAVDLLDRVGLSHRIEHTVATLSGGEQQRVAIARALVNRPLVVLADEPTGNLDSTTGQEIVELMHALRTQLNTAFVVATHDAKIVQQAGRVLHLVDGRFAAPPPAVSTMGKLAMQSE